MSAHPLAAGGRLRSALAIAAAVAVAGIMAGAPGRADAQPQPTIGQVQKTLARLTSQEDRVVQHYDQVAQQLASARQRLGLVNREVARDRSQFAAMRGQIAQIAAFAYENGTLSSSMGMLTSRNPRTVLSQASMLAQLASSRHQQLEQYINAARQLTSAQQAAQRTASAVGAIRHQLAGQKASLAALISKQRAILAGLTSQQQAAATAGVGGSTTGSYTGPAISNAQAARAVSFAFMVLNDRTPYVYGGTGPPGPSGGYDCSGLVQAAWAAAGVSIPRDTYSQYSTLTHVPMSAIQPGDLVFFDGLGHVGMYVGGHMLIDAPQPGMNVEEVSMSGWYSSTLVGAARP